MAIVADGDLYFSTLSDQAKKRYRDKVELISGEKYFARVDSYWIKDWTDDVEMWPSLSPPPAQTQKVYLPEVSF